MGTLADAAIALMRVDFSETSQIIVFFTRGHGKLRAIAKGVKRSTKTRFAVGIDLLDMGELVVSMRAENLEALATLTEWRQTRTLLGLRDRLPRLQAAQYAAEITALLTEDRDPHPALFDFLHGTLIRLCLADDTLAEVVRYQWDVLCEVGLLPRFDACVLCGREKDLTHFSSNQGGLVCRHCEAAQVEKRQVSPRTIGVLGNLFAQHEISNRSEPHDAHAQGIANPANPAAAFGLLDYHISHVAGRRPKLSSSLVDSWRQRLVD